MNRIDVAALFSAAFLVLSTHSAAQGGGQQLLTWDSSDWVPYSVHGGDQQDLDWRFYAYEKDGTHDANDLTMMLAVPASTQLDCNQALLPECWYYTPQPGGTCCYFVEYTGGAEQSSSVFASVRAWDAPFSGTAYITTPVIVSKPSGSTGGDGSMIRIYRNDLLFFEQELPRGASTISTGAFAIDEVIEVNAGDRLWFHNDPGGDTTDDGVIFLPVVTLSAGAGYDPSQVTRQSVADFISNHSQDENGWTYEAYERTSNTYSQMDANGVDGLGSYWQLGSTACKIWADRQHPSSTHDAVRIWTAPKDGFLMVESLTPLQKLAVGDAVHVQFRRIHEGNVEILWERTITDTYNTSFGAIANVRTGDRLALHVQSLVPSPSTSHAGVDVEMRLYPGGEIPLDPQSSSGDVTIAGEEFWFYEHRKITGNLVLQSGRLTTSNCTVELMNSYEKQYNYRFFGGELATDHTTIGGGTTTADHLHSNFDFSYPGIGRWTSNDTTVQYCFGTLLGDDGASSILVGNKHLSGPQADLIHMGYGADVMGYGADVSLTDSNYNVRLQFPADYPGDFSVDLPVDVPLTQAMDGNDIPGVKWSLDLVDTTVPNWDLAPYDMKSGPVDKTITLDNVERLWAEVDGTNLSGTVIPFAGILTDTLSIPSNPDERLSLDTFNIRWEGGPIPTDVKFWSYYLDGSGTIVNITPAGLPALIAELFVSAGARVTYIGAAGQYDAKCTANVIRCFGSGSRLILKNCELGTIYSKGSIRAENGAYIKIDGVRLVADVALQAVGNSTIEVLNIDPSSAGVFDCCIQPGSTITINGVSNCPTCPF